MPSILRILCKIRNPEQLNRAFVKNGSEIQQALHKPVILILSTSLSSTLSHHGSSRCFLPTPDSPPPLLPPSSRCAASASSLLPTYCHHRFLPFPAHGFGSIHGTNAGPLVRTRVRLELRASLLRDPRWRLLALSRPAVDEARPNHGLHGR